MIQSRFWVYLWRGTTTGTFSVKSAYLIAKEMVQMRRNKSKTRGKLAVEGTVRVNGREYGTFKSWNFFYGDVIMIYFLWMMVWWGNKFQWRANAQSVGWNRKRLHTCSLDAKGPVVFWILSPFRFRPEELASTSQLARGDMGQLVGWFWKGRSKNGLCWVCWWQWSVDTFGRLEMHAWVFKMEWTEET